MVAGPVSTEEQVEALGALCGHAEERLHSRPCELRERQFGSVLVGVGDPGIEDVRLAFDDAPVDLLLAAEAGIERGPGRPCPLCDVGDLGSAEAGRVEHATGGVEQLVFVEAAATWAERGADGHEKKV
ncbi:hypothetical protein O1M63_49115 [Streptomyces mirabilis]|nr:hypothetical protein [Streptomyces mirabilis]